MYYSGMSYKQVAENMEDVFDAPEPSKATVHDWVKGYTGLALRFLAGEVGEDGTPATATDKRVKADVGDHWVADELVLKVGGRKYWCWNVMDKDTRYALAARLSSSRDTYDAIAVFEKALANAARPPTKITTDGLGSYVDAVRAVFPNGTKHEVSDGIYEEVNNNLSERLQGSLPPADEDATGTGGKAHRAGLPRWLGFRLQLLQRPRGPPRTATGGCRWRVRAGALGQLGGHHPPRWGGGRRPGSWSTPPCARSPG